MSNQHKRLLIFICFALGILYFFNTRDSSTGEQWDNLPIEISRQISEEQRARLLKEYSTFRSIMNVIAHEHFSVHQTDTLVNGFDLGYFATKVSKQLLSSDEQIVMLFEETIDEILATLDPYTKYFSASDIESEERERFKSYVIVLDKTIALFNFDKIDSEITTRKFQEFLKAVLNEPSSPIQHIILDVRRNSGGDVNTTYDFIDLLTSQQVIGEIEQRVVGKPEISVKTIEGELPQITDLPITILISEQTASSAELLAGTLQQLGRAKIVGKQSKGKAMGQVHKDISHITGGNSHLLITAGKLFYPDGTSYQDVGVVPDIIVNSVEENIEHLEISRQLTPEQQVSDSTNVAKIVLCTERDIDKSIMVDIYDPIQNRSAKVNAFEKGGLELICAFQHIR